jgi:uncharacterized phage-associated protein
MKINILVKIILFQVLLTFPFIGSANEENLVEKSKTFNRSYPVNMNDVITLQNQFGEMKINTWDRNEIKVDIKIFAKANTDEKAQNILDNIYIQESKSSSGVSFVTKMKNEKNNWTNSKENSEYKVTGMKIDYVVFMPAGNPLNASNQFGPMILTDLKGPVTLSTKFGSLTAGRLSQVQEVEVEFGEAKIESVNGGTLIVKFGKGDILQVTGDVDARFEFCNKLRLGVDNNTKALNIRSSYSNIYLNAPSNLSSSIDIKTSFGEFSNKTAFDIKKLGDDESNKHGPKFDKQYNGITGSGSNKLKVKSDFGNVIIGHNLKVDFTTNKKSKVI